MTKAKLFTATFNRMMENIKEINVAEIFVGPGRLTSSAVLGRRVPVGGQGVEQLQRRRSQRGLEVVADWRE